MAAFTDSDSNAVVAASKAAIPLPFRLEEACAASLLRHEDEESSGSKRLSFLACACVSSIGHIHC